MAEEYIGVAMGSKDLPDDQAMPHVVVKLSKISKVQSMVEICSVTTNVLGACSVADEKPKSCVFGLSVATHFLCGGGGYPARYAISVEWCEIQCHEQDQELRGLGGRARRLEGTPLNR